jgi:hypothetical protein
MCHKGLHADLYMPGPPWTQILKSNGPAHICTPSTMIVNDLVIGRLWVQVPPLAPGLTCGYVRVDRCRHTAEGVS